MTWARFDDATADHPKFSALGDDAPRCGWLWFSATCYCTRYLTDGRIDLLTLRRLWPFSGGDVDELVAKLVGARLLEDHGQGQYRVHDFLDYNPSREQVMEARATRTKAGQRGGQASAQARAQANRWSIVDTRFNPRPVPSPTPIDSPQPHAQAFASDMEQANAQANGQRSVKHVVEHVLDQHHPPVDPDHWEKQRAALQLLKKVIEPPQPIDKAEEPPPF